MTKSEALKKLQAIKSYMTSGNPMWSVEPIGEAFDMAIEALQAKTDGDTISRQAAIDAVTGAIWHYPNECYKNLNVYEVAEELVSDAIKSLPSAEPKTEWIPVSERVPENSDTVLITHRGGVSFGWYNGRYWERGASTKHRPLQTVVAWMPLPEPYKGETDENMG